METEQLLHDERGYSPESSTYAPLHCTSFVQLRGSIPLFWCHTSTNAIKPEIRIYKVDPLHRAMTMHFRDVEHRYGSPITIWNLIKHASRDAREGVLGSPFEEACRFYSKGVPEDRALTYHDIDFKQLKHDCKAKGVSPIEHLCEEADGLIQKTGIFYTESVSMDRTHFVAQKLQRGILRSNCIDCLDRTNAAQFAAARTALTYQLDLLGLASKETLDMESQFFHKFLEEFKLMGHYIAQQYGGSQAHADSLKMGKGGDWAVSRTGLKVMTDIRRYYSNTFTDADKQHAMNLFMGIFIPSRGQPHLWESEGTITAPSLHDHYTITAPSHERAHTSF